MKARRPLFLVALVAVLGGLAILSMASAPATAAEAASARSPRGASPFTHSLVQAVSSQIGAKDLLVWLIVGAVAGSVTAVLVTWRRSGFGGITNLAIGLLGAVLGGFLFEILRWNLSLGSITIQYQDLAAALVGSLLLLLCAGWLRVRWSPRRRRA
jgi:uncharacterized membrane protein YeaQ/YmgE (transglycosylase-associated protein family)